MLLALVALAGVARADEITTCVFGSPTPGYRVIKLELPEGTNFLSIEPHGARSTRVTGDESWHLAHGLIVVNAETLAMEAYRVEAIGSSPRAVVVAADGTAVARQGHPAPDGPFYHTTARPRSGLPAGTYYAIGFGSDGSATQPNEWWGADLRLAGRHRCTTLGAGEVFDIDHTEFRGGTHAYAHAAGIGEDLTYEHTTSRRLVVGFIDAAVQLAGEAEVTYSMPSGSGTINDEIVPFASLGGPLKFDASYSGLYPTILVAGVALDI